MLDAIMILTPVIAGIAILARAIWTRRPEIIGRNEAVKRMMGK